MKPSIIFLLTMSLIEFFPIVKRIQGNYENESNMASVIEEDRPILSIREGLVSQSVQTIWVKRRNKIIGYIELSEPVMVAQAEKEEEWGFFQFPNISKTENEDLVVTWHMKEDTYESYGKSPSRYYAPMISKDKGQTWAAKESTSYLINEGYDCLLSDSSTLRVNTPPAKDISEYTSFPKEVFRKGSYVFYEHNSVPSDLQGVYLYSIDKNHHFNSIHAKLDDPELLRYAIDGKMPIVWWGNIRQLSDNSLLAGVYPGKYLDKATNDVNSGISFYTSYDFGKTWQIKGRIPFRADGIADKLGDSCYEEPTFEVLKDGKLLCVMRTGSYSPMYKSFSSDRGRTWSIPVPFTPNGVLPWLKILNNGVLVLVSGRPGVQIRFSMDGTGRNWTSPIDMLPFMNSDGSYMRDVSCGYTSIIGTDDNSFYLVYSDFYTTNIYGQKRKAIMFRRIKVQTIINKK